MSNTIDNYIIIQLTQGKVALIDKKDLKKTLKYKWCYNKSYGTNGYAVCNIYPVDYSHPKKIYLHRLIVSAKKGEIVDHINRNTLDNRKENLRIVDRAGNYKHSLYYQERWGYNG